ncbi:unnamed protein product [Coregonus sp. 'balchen']|nr:unnamed protein product [Coregonus sp. 'balchen']
MDTVNGVARCPYDPRHNSTAMVTEKGELYAATVIDFSGRDPVIYRSLDPHFISVYEVGLFTYFFLRENAVEHDCGRTVFSRVARVCKNDVGGRFLLEDTWTTFMKARLNCSRAITQAFNGPFRYQENPRTSWLSTPNPIPNFQCDTLEERGPGENQTERSLQDAQRLFLMSDVVQPVSTDPLLHQDNIRFSKLVVDIVQGRDTLYHVMYIGTEYGTILKALSTTNKSLRGCYLEEMRLLPEGESEPIRSLQILHSDRHCLDARDPYCGWDRKQKRCTTIEDSSNMSQWSQNITECPVRNLTQDGGFSPWTPWQPCNHDDGEGASTSCACRSRSCNSPVPQCGGSNCKGPTIQVANCSRLCNEKSPCPLPVFWSSWGSWSKCSAECGGGVHSRVRSCEKGNTCPGCALEYKTCNLEACPEVRRNTPWTPWMPVNVTQDGARQEQRARYTCRALLPDPRQLQLGKKKVETRVCPNDGTATCETEPLVEDLVRSSGGDGSGRPLFRQPGGTRWSPWESWSTCSQECAKGFRTRKRTCASAEGKSTSSACSGSPVEYQDCNSQPCPGGHYQRTRTCSNPAPANGGDICIGLHTEEALCNTHTCEGGWLVWSEWRECDEEGLQHRSRECGEREADPSLCQGNATTSRPCQSREVPVVLPGQDNDQRCGAFSLFHLMATGALCFFAAVGLSVLVYAYCQRLHKPSQDSAVIHPTTPNHLSYKGNTTPKNEKYTPMEFKSCNFFPSPLSPLPSLPQNNVYTTTYYPAPLGKYDHPFHPDSPCRNYMHHS